MTATKGKSEQGGVRKARAAETATRLKEAARTVFDRRGYLNTKVTDITAEAGRAAGSFYNHFASKEELLETLAADFMAEADELIGERGQFHDLSDPAVLREHIAVFWTIYTCHHVEIEAMRQAAFVDAGFAGKMRTYRAEQLRPWREHLERLRDVGVALPSEPRIVADALVALLEGFCQTWLADGGSTLSAEEAIDVLTAMAMHGIVGTAQG